MTASLPRFARDLLASCPRAGAGVHTWLFRAARVLHPFYSDASELARLLSAACAGCGRAVMESEVRSAIINSRACAWEPNQRPFLNAVPAAWPGVDADRVKAITADGPGLADLWENSPVRFEDNVSHVEALVDQLFPDNPLLCCGKNTREFATRTREEWRGHLASQAQIVPSAMSAPTGLTKDGRTSAHTLANTGPRRFLVVEFDSGGFDEHAALLVHLRSKAPLAIAMHSGNKSLHGWFYCADQPEDRVLKFFRYAVSLGADRALWSRSQFARLPDGTRDDGKPQRAFYFNPSTLKS